MHMSYPAISGRNAIMYATSSSTEPARAYDLMPPIQNKTIFTTNHQSPDHSDHSLERQSKTKSRWELVCNRKEQMIINK